MDETTQNNFTQQDESALAARALIDSAAFSALFDRYFPLVHKYMLYRVGDLMSADDLTAEVFEHLLVALPRFNPARAPFGAFLFGIARHTVNDHYRIQKRKQDISVEEIHQLAARDPQPEETSLLKEEDHHLLAALKKLSNREKEIISLKFGAELTNRQIAKLTGLGESHVGVILYRSMQHLRLMFTEMEESYE